MAWDGTERREHDETCDRRITSLKNELVAQLKGICNKYAECHSDLEKVKEHKADKTTLSGGFKLLWGVMGIIVFSIVIGGMFGYAQTEDMKAINGTQDTRLGHIEEDDRKIEKKLDDHIQQQNIVNQSIINSLHKIELSLEGIKKDVQ